MTDEKRPDPFRNLNDVNWPALSDSAFNAKKHETFAAARREGRRRKIAGEAGRILDEEERLETADDET